MKFYNRTSELKTLREIEKASFDNAQMTMVLGRRRVGKTTLLSAAFKNTPVLYFFIAKKNEVLLCEEFVGQANEKLSVELGTFKTFASLFKALMVQSKAKNFTLIIDEIQEFANANPSVFSDIQNIWDSYKNDSKINLIFCGSIYSMMKKIFENSKEPLFGRITSKIIVKPFSIGAIKQVIKDFNPKFTNEDLLAFYTLTGATAKYVEQCALNKAFSKNKILDMVFKENSFFFEEGRAVLIEEFGKDYGNYFSILSLIAASKNDRSDIENALQMQVGGYLDRLEKDYGLIKRNKPFGAKKGSKLNKYIIEDNFLNFWFRFIYKYRSAVEIGNVDYVRAAVERDYYAYSGQILEKYFRTALAETKKFSSIGAYWDRKGEKEINIIAANELEKRIVFYEVKRNPSKINIELLKQKSVDIVKQYPDFKIEYKKLSLEDM
ncbi:MAG: ATP-binding protein [Endomicrobium sp.]|jgi:AAA+ ATPase superfamily predicted ATPase|nr:ATP-binding protein [Endomicrobium sp.]